MPHPTICPRCCGPRNCRCASSAAHDIALAVVLALGLVLILCRSAIGVPPTPLGVLVARVCANESSRVLRPASDGGTSGEIDADCRAIWHTVTTWAAWRRTTPDAAIRALAPHVTSTRAARKARHAMYATLPARGSAPPASWRDDAHGPWSVYGAHWARFRARVAQLVSSTAVAPCDGDPIAWGGDMDTPIALRRGLVRLDCGDTLNNFWALPPSRTLAADIAAGKATP